MGNGTGAAATFGGQTADLQNFDLKNIRTLAYDQEFDNGNSGAGTVTINVATNGALQKIKLTGNPTFAFTPPVAPGRFQLKLTQDGGTRTVTWPAEGVSAGNLAWTGKAAPTLSTATGAVDIVNVYYDGSVYWGVASLNFG